MQHLLSEDVTPGGPRLISRRRLLKGLGIAGVAGVAGVATGFRGVGAIASTETVVRQAPGYTPWLWSDPRAWADGRVPGPDDHAIVSSPLLVEGDVSVGAVTIEATGALVFSPHTAT
ncbi:MAG: twin-arginine translocation signal domain-containing protein, partial [Actinomycetota bacterium]|nr:twin-arginine translocation signal domain-containing protein [Actinomycetota bacterium]